MGFFFRKPSYLTQCLQFLDYNIAFMSLFECRILKYLQRTLCASSMVVDRALGRLGIFPGVGCSLTLRWEVAWSWCVSTRVQVIDGTVCTGSPGLLTCEVRRECWPLVDPNLE